MVSISGNWAQFSFYRPEAERVYLAGDFNGWRQGELPMKRSPHGYWTANLRLPAGVFKFRYCADGRWFCDFAAFGVEYGPFGPDSVLRVSR